jgi:O-antigen ligase
MNCINNISLLPKMLDINQLRVFYSFGLLIVGVIYPEDKTLIGGVPWPPFMAALGLVLVVALKRELMNGLVISTVTTLWVLSILGFSLVLGVFGITMKPEIEFVLRHYLTLLITTIVSFLLISDLQVRLILKGIYRFGFALALILLVIRLLLFDFSREATFLGLGPLTFAKYVCIGWIAKIAHDGGIRLIPSLVFALALFVADSKGPILFFMITIALFVYVNNRVKKLHALFFILIFIIFISLSGRFVELGTDLTSIVTGELMLPDSVEFEAQAEDELISGTLARLIAFNSSIEFIFKQPFYGWGIGSWPYLTGLHYLKYPHNSFLEIWFEYGIYGMGIFCFFVASACYGLLRKNPFSLFVIFCAFLSLTTGSIRDLRMLIFFVILAHHFMINYKSVCARYKPDMSLKESMHVK